MKKMMLATFTFALFATGMAMADEETRMLHFEMTVQQEGEPVEVKVNLPLTLIENMVPNIQNTLDEMDLEEQDVDLKALWREVRAAGPNEFVRVKKEGENITVNTDETHLRISLTTEEQGEINVVIPLVLGDIILGGETIDVNQIVEELSHWEGDLVTITGDQINGRAWID